jgi:dethiobiotin synthetase
MKYFITAIGTDSGKTLVSAIFTEAMQADYWKPVQAGFPRDTETVKSLITNSSSIFHQEAYLLNHPMSPHAAAKLDNVEIEMSRITLPISDRPLIIEGAGGMLVPLNDKDYVIDLAVKFDVPVILVSNLYLGSINHTLLSIEALKHRNIKVKGIVFNGRPNFESERIIELKSGWPVLLRVQQEPAVTAQTVRRYAEILRKNLG